MSGWAPSSSPANSQMSATARAFIAQAIASQAWLEYWGNQVEQGLGDGRALEDYCTIEEGLALDFFLGANSLPVIYGTNPTGTPGLLEPVTVPGDGTPTTVAVFNAPSDVPMIAEAKLHATCDPAQTITAMVNSTSPAPAGVLGTGSEVDLTAFTTGLGTAEVEQGGRLATAWDTSGTSGTVQLRVTATTDDGSDLVVVGVIVLTPALIG